MKDIKERLFAAIENEHLPDFIYDMIYAKVCADGASVPFGIRDDVVYFNEAEMILYDCSGKPLLQFDEGLINSMPQEYYLLNMHEIIDAVKEIYDAEEVLIIKD